MFWRELIPANPDTATLDGVVVFGRFWKRSNCRVAGTKEFRSRPPLCQSCAGNVSNHAPHPVISDSRLMRLDPALGSRELSPRSQRSNPTGYSRLSLHNFLCRLDLPAFSRIKSPLRGTRHNASRVGRIPTISTPRPAAGITSHRLHNPLCRLELPSIVQRPHPRRRDPPQRLSPNPYSAVWATSRKKRPARIVPSSPSSAAATAARYVIDR